MIISNSPNTIQHAKDLKHTRMKLAELRENTRSESVTWAFRLPAAPLPAPAPAPAPPAPPMPEPVRPIPPAREDPVDEPLM